MSMPADCSHTVGARRQHATAARLNATPARSERYVACAHPLVFGSLAALSVAPLLVAGRRSNAVLAQPAAMAAVGWLGARYGRTCQGDHAAMARLLGTTVGAAAASAVAHFVQAMGHCLGAPLGRVAQALFYAASGGCSAGVGGLLGAAAWSGWAAPVGTGAGCLAASLVGAYALGGLSLVALL